MGFWDWLTKAETPPPEETRSSDGFLRFEDVFGTTPNTLAGVQVDQETGTRLPVVYRCVQLNAATISLLPLDTLEKLDNARREIPTPSWLEQPHQEYDWMQFIQEVQTGLELDGNAFILKIASSNGSITGLLHLDPRMVDVERKGGQILYTLRLAHGGKETYTSRQMIHIKAFTRPRSLRGVGPIGACMDAIGQGLAAQEFGQRFFGEGATLSGVIQTPGNLTEENATRLQESFKKGHAGVSKSHAIGVLSGGATWQPLSIKPEEAQFLETQKLSGEQISWLFGIPPWFSTSAEGAKGFVTGVMAGRMMWLQFGLLWRVVRLERTFSALLPARQYIKLNLRSFLRPDATEQSALMDSEIRNRVRTPNEWRELLDLDPLPGGDEPLSSVQWQTESPQ